MCLILSLFYLYGYIFLSVIGATQFCQDSADCRALVGTTCKNSTCLCKPGSHVCPLVLGYGEKCSTDEECGFNLVCDVNIDYRACICRRGQTWASRHCHTVDEDIPYIYKQSDITRNLWLLSFIFCSLLAAGGLVLVACSNDKSWAKRRGGEGGEMVRSLEEPQWRYDGTNQPATWIASYRVFGTVERSGPPCLLLPVGPPAYEEALKHKVILSSYHPPTVA